MYLTGRMRSFCAIFLHTIQLVFFLLINAKKTRKNSAVHWKSRVLDPIMLDVTTKHFNK